MAGVRKTARHAGASKGITLGSVGGFRISLGIKRMARTKAAA